MEETKESGTGFFGYETHKWGNQWLSPTFAHYSRLQPLYSSVQMYTQILADQATSQVLSYIITNQNKDLILLFLTATHILT